jgi:hypothetical protein
MDIQRSLRCSGVIPIVLQSLTEYNNYPIVVLKTLIAISELAKDAINREILINAGVCNKIVDIVQPHFENQDILCAFVLAVHSFVESPIGETQFIEKMRNTLTHDEIKAFVDTVYDMDDGYL